MRNKIKSKLQISKSSWSPQKSDDEYVNYFSIPNFDLGFPKKEKTSDIKSGKFLINQPCILISKLNPGTPRVWLIQDLLSGVNVCSTEFVVLIPNEKLDLKYIYFLLKSNTVTNKLTDMSTGTSNSHQRVRPESILELEVDWNENANERYVLSEFLWGLEQKISTNTAISKTLEEIAQTIFKSWFIDFDPVKAKMNGEKLIGMDDETAALFPDSLEESELGLIPKGWSAGKFGDSSNLLMGQSPPGDSYNSDGVGLPFYQGRTDFGFRFPKRRIFCTQENRVAQAGETLISVRAPVGDINQAIEKCIIGRGVASVMHKSGSEAYSYSLLKSLYPVLSYYNGEGTVFGAINRNDFHNLLIVEPSQKVVKAYDRVCSPINDEVRTLHLCTETLIGVRDSLLPRLISGELQIPEEMLAS